MTNLQKRIVATAIYLPIFLLSTFSSQTFALAISVLLALSWHEYLIFRTVPVTLRDWIQHAALILLGTLPILAGGLNASPGKVLLFMAFIFQLLFIRNLFHQQKFEMLLQNLTFYLLGFFYVTGLFSCLWLLRDQPGGMQAVWFLILIVGLADTGAYFVGRWRGRTPFFQHISPSKTLEGVVGGVASALAGSAGFYFLMVTNDYSVPTLSACIGMAFVCALFAVFGDLFESMLKRHYGVKDSGHVLPGHGGILDRFDGLIFAALPLLFLIVLRGGFR